MRERDDRAYEHVAIRGDGSRFPVEVRGKHSTIQGVPVRVTAIRDITQRKKDESERERLIAELTARNAEMERFTYTVSHDLKSPLITIYGFLGALKHDIEAGDSERFKNDMQRIASAASKMMRLLNDLLELSRVGRVAFVAERFELARWSRKPSSSIGSASRPRSARRRRRLASGGPGESRAAARGVPEPDRERTQVHGRFSRIRSWGSASGATRRGASATCATTASGSSLCTPSEFSVSSRTRSEVGRNGARACAGAKDPRVSRW